MKNLALYVFVLLMTSCKMMSGEDQTIANPENTYNIVLNPEPGLHYNYAVSTNTEMEMEVDDKKINNKNESIVEMNYGIEKDSTGNFVFTLTYDKVHLNIKNGDTETEADMANANFPLNPVEKMLGALKNANLQATVTSTGELKQLAGYKELSQRLMSGLDTTNAYVKETAQKQLDKIVGDGMVKSNLDQLFKIFPDSAIHVGDKWKLVAKQSGDFILNVTGFYELKDINQDLAIIHSKSDMESDNTPLAMMGSAVIPNLKGKQNGEYEIEAKTGMVINATVRSEIKGTIQTMGKEIPITIETTQIIKGRRSK